MTSEELELHLADLYEWLALNGGVLRGALEAVRVEGVSRYPLLVVLSGAVALSASSPALVWLPTVGGVGLWRGACTTAEWAARAGWLAAEKVDDFLSLYREHSATSACIFLVLEEQQQWIFVDMRRLSQAATGEEEIGVDGVAQWVEDV